MDQEFIAMQNSLLMERANEAFLKARAFYSGFQVGAALLLEDGSIYEGFNVEADNSSVSICAERVAVVHAMIYSKAKFKTLAIIADTEGVISPCGLCRQFLSEFRTLNIIMANLKGDHRSVFIKDLIPYPFQRKQKKPEYYNSCVHPLTGDQK